jgi:hypothetical protein
VTGHIPPPSAGDVLLALSALDWPAVMLAHGRSIEGEDSWRAAVEAADGPGRMQLWQALSDEGPALRAAIEEDSGASAPRRRWYA